jgi:hypothetical protein
MADYVSATEYLTYMFGTLCAISWAASFPPQLWESYKRGNTYGLAYEAVFL